MPEDSKSGSLGSRWSAPAEDLRRAVHEPVLAALPQLGVIRVGGPDAAAFLNSQLTVDVKALDTQRWQLGAYCSPKGRVLAIIEIWRDEDGYGLLLPRELLEPVRARLARFVLRSKVHLDDASAQWSVLGLTGPGVEQALQAAGLPDAQAPWTCRTLDGGARLVGLPPGPRCTGRRMLIAGAADANGWRQRLQGFTPVDAGVWWWSKIDAGLPEVVAATQERFVPQMLNLDVLGGVHFSKGCYPGQEVVARSQYLGKLRRRMSTGNATQAGAGDDVLGDDGTAVGTVVLAAASPAGGVDLLLECPLEMAQTAHLHTGTSARADIVLGELPYPIVNPTA